VEDFVPPAPLALPPPAASPANNRLIPPSHGGPAVTDVTTLRDDTRAELKEARDAFDSAAAVFNMTFTSAAERGTLANILIGRPADARDAFTPADWREAAAALPNYVEALNDSDSEDPVAVEDEAPAPAPVPLVPATAPTVAAAVNTEEDDTSDLEDPFADDLPPAASPKKGKTDTRNTNSPAGML